MKNKNTETPGKKGNNSRDSNRVSNITLAKECPRSNCNEDDMVSRGMILVVS